MDDDKHKPKTEEQIRAYTIGALQPLKDRVQIVAYDPAWVAGYEREAGQIRQALGVEAMKIEHVGSTSVPGLAAKPVIDILLVVADSAAEVCYESSLERIGYQLRIREPDWYEHRMFKRAEPEVNLHIFSAGCPEIERLLLFRDWLRADASDRVLYERTKMELAKKEWKFTQNYADAKTAVINEILERARRNQ